ncbi:MAG TPA: hypothetical protein PKJ98_09540 [Verrucomicrobiota bacterium]|nr:hypothetical protein [Verrucomicrobiota bacterium]
MKQAVNKATRGAAENRRPAGQSEGSGNVSAIGAGNRAFPAAVGELPLGDNRIMTARCKVVIAACLAGLVLAGVGAHRFLRFLLRVGVPRIVARAVSPDGVEMCIVQECNFSTEPFTTSFVYRKPGADWGWFYFDHEDWYWGTGRVSVDTSNQVAVFYASLAESVGQSGRVANATCSLRAS